MKRSVLIVTAAAVVLTPLAATAAPAKASKRTITFEYTGFSSAGHSAAGSFHFAGGCAVADSCMEFETKKGEKTIEVKSSQPTAGIQIWFDDAYADNVQLFCGAGKISVSPKTSHVINVSPSAHDCGSVPTEGTLTATLSNSK